MRPATSLRRLIRALLPVLAASLLGASLGACAFWEAVGKPILFPRPTPSPTVTSAPTEAPRATPRATVEPRETATATAATAAPTEPTEPTETPTAAPRETPTARPSPAPRAIAAAAPYICKWRVGSNKPKPAKLACYTLSKLRPDGTYRCVKDSTDLYCTDDPLNRWPACRPTYADGSPMSPECTASKFSNPCLAATCSGGVPLARPRDWGNCSGPARECHELTTGKLVSCTASGWQTIIVARPGARVRLETWAPLTSITCDGLPVPAKPKDKTLTWVELVF